MTGPEIDEEPVRRLAALLHETGLDEIEYAEGDRRIRVARHRRPADRAPAPAEPGPGAAAEEARPGAPAFDPADTVAAPMVGTVYVAPEPGAAPFVRPGDTVSEGDTLLLIEAMKTFNPVRAPRAGRVARVLVADSAPVEYGEALIVLE